MASILCGPTGDNIICKVLGIDQGSSIVVPDESENAKRVGGVLDAVVKDFPRNLKVYPTLDAADITGECLRLAHNAKELIDKITVRYATRPGDWAIGLRRARNDLAYWIKYLEGDKALIDQAVKRGDSTVSLLTHPLTKANVFKDRLTGILISIRYVYNTIDFVAANDSLSFVPTWVFRSLTVIKTVVVKIARFAATVGKATLTTTMGAFDLVNWVANNFLLVAASGAAFMYFSAKKG